MGMEIIDNLKDKDLYLHIFDRYEVWWEDTTSHSEWQQITEAKKDKPVICFTEGYLLHKNRDAYIFFMSICSAEEIGDQIVIPSKNIKKLTKTGSRNFLAKEFEYDTYKKVAKPQKQPPQKLPE